MTLSLPVGHRCAQGVGGWRVCPASWLSGTVATATALSLSGASRLSRNTGLDGSPSGAGVRCPRRMLVPFSRRVPVLLSGLNRARNGQNFNPYFGPIMSFVCDLREGI